MTTTPNRNYSLPSRHHDVVDDINDLRTTFGAVDEDITNIENAVTELADDVSDTQATVIHTDSALENTEIQNIAANRYLVVNRTGDGFECLDGDGDAGGKTGQCSIKKSDQEFDTAWGNISEVSKNGMIVKENAESSESGETHIFVDETEVDNDEQLPKVELTNCQAKSDFKSDSNSSVIIRDNIEEVKEEIQTATNLNYGFVKVGSGLSIDNGTLSAPVYSAATVDDFGLVKTGSGINNNNGVISYDAISSATLSSFGVVKLGENLSINSNGEMEIDDMGTSATIYDLGNVKVCNNGIVELEEATLRYRLFVTEDLMIQFSMDFEPRDDFSFVLELVSDGTHLVAFSENLNPQMSTLPINRGITKITFVKKLGMPIYDFEISRLDGPEPICLTPAIESCITSEFSITAPQGSSAKPNYVLRTDLALWNYTDVQELNFKFETLVCVDYVNYISRADNVAMTNFILRGSNDGKNWTTLIYKSNEVIYGKVYTEVKGCFRYFNMKIGYNSDDNKPTMVSLWGTQLDNNESELIPITPYMGSNQTTFATMTGNNITQGGASDLTDFNFESYVILAKESDNWIKYELSEARVANLIELNYRPPGWSYSFSGDCQPNWFKLEGSNDDTTWTLLLERQYLGAELERENNVLFFDFNNQTAYKYYKFTCIATNSSSAQWNICGFKLYQRARGKHNFYNLVPTLTSATQDGYEVTGSSQWDSGSAPYYAFDDDKATRWVASSTGTQWLQVKLPTATVCNVARITSRPESVDVNQAPTSFEIQGSNDGETWDTLTSQSGVTWTSAGETQSFSFSNNETAYLYYRLYITANGGGPAHALAEFVIGRSAYEYKRYLDKYEYLVPVMSANSQDGYVASAESVYNNDSQAWRAFTRTSANIGDGWGSRQGTTTSSDGTCNTWIQIQLPEAKIANSLYIAPKSSVLVEQLPKDFTLKGSNDGTNWTTLLTQTDQSYTAKTWDFENTTAYRYYRLSITKGTRGVDSPVSIGQFDLFYTVQIIEY